ncbi:MAG: hypothetical protein J6M48_03540 [Ruminococcus sp.]|nr:hypothetical protein [Ruminococcus sp.]
MIFNYIAFGLAGLFLLLSLISVIAEAVSPYHKPTRRLRITLREVTKLPFVAIAGIVLLIGNKVSGAKFQFTAIALGIFFLSLIILHWFKISKMLRSRRRAVKKTPLAPLRKTALNERASPEAPLARVLEPKEPEVIEGQLSQS